MEQLKQLNLTEDDFQMLIDGLDALPEKGVAGSIMMSLLTSSLFKEDSEAKEKWDREQKAKDEKREREKIILVENAKILQGKLLMLKRHFVENNLLKSAEDILNGTTNS